MVATSQRRGNSWQPVSNGMSQLEAGVTINMLYHIFPDLLMERIGQGSKAWQVWKKVG
jgi:hypothetical protein